MAEIILVHGIAQEQGSADSLEEEWIPALAGGVRTAGNQKVADQIRIGRLRTGGIETRMAFYGHLFLRPGQQGLEPPDLSDNELAFAESLALEWLERAATNSPHRREKEIANEELNYVRREVGRDEMGVGDLVRRAIKSVARVQWFAPFGMAFAERFVFEALAQVTKYLMDEGIRLKAQRAVRDLVDADTKVLIGHSLGSVVAYEVAHQIEQPLNLLITLGSPLGLHTIIYEKLRPQPPTYPRNALRWINVANKEDYIAAEIDLTEQFSNQIPPTARFEGCLLVDNGSAPHSSEFYLHKVEIGKPVGEEFSRR